MKKTEKKFDEILLDLLSSGLGATIILMLIFSLNLSGIFSNVKKVSYEAPLPNIGDASLVSRDKQKRKSMSSIRFVTIDGLGRSRGEELKKSRAKIEGFWEIRDWHNHELYKQFEKELNKSYQVEIKDNSTTFYFFCDHILGTTEFIIPEDINLANCKVTVGIIEGTSTVLSEKFPDGIYGRKNYILSNIKKGLKVIFRTGTLRNKNLITIQ